MDYYNFQLFYQLHLLIIIVISKPLVIYMLGIFIDKWKDQILLHEIKEEKKDKIFHSRIENCFEIMEWKIKEKLTRYKMHNGLS